MRSIRRLIVEDRLGIFCTFLPAAFLLNILEKDSCQVFWEQISGSELHQSSERISPSCSVMQWQPLFSYSSRRTIVKSGIPEVIYEAVCDSAHCDYPLRDSDALESLIAVPIHQVLLVLQRQTGRSKCYVAHYRRVVVGCTCVWAKTSTNIHAEWVYTQWQNPSKP